MSRTLQPKLWQYTSWPSLEKLGISKKKWEVQKDHRILMFVCLFFPKEKGSRASLMPNTGLVTEDGGVGGTFRTAMTKARVAAWIVGRQASCRQF